jgi:hypothetical protein
VGDVNEELRHGFVFLTVTEISAAGGNLSAPANGRHPQCNGSRFCFGSSPEYSSSLSERSNWILSADQNRDRLGGIPPFAKNAKDGPPAKEGLFNTDALEKIISGFDL